MATNHVPPDVQAAYSEILAIVRFHATEGLGALRGSRVTPEAQTPERWGEHECAVTLPSGERFFVHLTCLTRPPSAEPPAPATVVMARWDNREVW